MRIVLQRVRRAEVRVGGEKVGSIGVGLAALVGFGGNDAPGMERTSPWTTMLRKMLQVRIFPDANDRLNLSLDEYGGELLLVSQFTLYADCRKGRRPSFTPAAAPETARVLFDALARDAAAALGRPVATGRFGADMDVDLVNWGPVTILLDRQTLCP
jgi:D-tyrosyl-tRNA(Tyr) deacylase